MTVAELISRLGDFPPDLPVWISSDDPECGWTWEASRLGIEHVQSSPDTTIPVRVEIR